MPIYEYECETCGYRHEVLQRVGDPLLTDCPECTKPALKKLVSVAAFRLSGSGWYETDFKSDNKRNLVSDDSRQKDKSKDGKGSGEKDSGKKAVPEKNAKDSGAGKDTKSAVNN